MPNRASVKRRAIMVKGPAAGAADGGSISNRPRRHRRHRRTINPSNVLISPNIRAQAHRRLRPRRAMPVANTTRATAIVRAIRAKAVTCRRLRRQGPTRAMRVDTAVTTHATGIADAVAIASAMAQP